MDFTQEQIQYLRSDLENLFNVWVSQKVEDDHVVDLELQSFEDTYMRLLTGQQPLPHDVFRIFLRQYSGVINNIREKIKNNDSKMNRDGSNYTPSLALVVPAITSLWTICRQDGTTLRTSTDNAISVENGAKVNYSGSFSYPAADDAHKAPASCDGAFGTTLPDPATPSATLNRTDITTATTLTANLYAPKSGLEVSAGKVIQATGNDHTAATASVAFLHRRFYGTSANPDADITTLSSELSNSRAKTINFDCSGGKYFYYAYPKTLGTATWKVGGLAFSGYQRTEQTITNEYGLPVTYYIYRSTELQTGSAINSVIS